MTDFSKLLNHEQCAAATAGDGPILVLAAAGTGKTRTLVHRVAYLAEKGVSADRIMLLTFTNRAAREMLERAGQVVGPSVSTIWSGTFHSVCSRLLRRYGSFLGYRPDYAILDEDDQRKLIGEIIKTSVASPKDFPKKEVVAKMISEAANEGVPVETVAGRWQTKVAGFEPGDIVKIASTYASKKLELGAMDFDDLLVNGLRLLKEQPRVREALQERFLHVLVDEYQDTNGLQAEFTDILAAKSRNIMAVGDDFQCIYTWRGAQISNILEFPGRWDGCRIIKLERNYRSLPGVLDVANVVMRDAPRQFEKTLLPVRSGAGERPWLCSTYDGREQAGEVLKTIGEMRLAGFANRDIAILYRSHFQSIDIQMALARANVPFRITSGVGVFEQVHSKDVLAYLRLVLNPADELSFLRLAELLPGVGEKSARSYWAKLGRSFDCSRPGDREALGSMLGAKARAVWPPLAKCFECAHDHLDAGDTGGMIDDFCDLFYEDHLNREWERQEAEDRLDDIRELAAQIAGDAGDCDNGRERLSEFLADVALMTNLDARKNDPGQDRITLSTVHQAKGMEWPVVIVPWLSEGMFPNGKAVEEGRLDEERRLFYVAVTRAKDRLYMFSPQVRRMSDGGMFPVQPSMFAKEMPDGLVNRRRVRSFSSGGSGFGGSGFGGGFQRGGRGAGGAAAYRTTWRR